MHALHELIKERCEHPCNITYLAYKNSIGKTYLKKYRVFGSKRLFLYCIKEVTEALKERIDALGKSKAKNKVIAKVIDALEEYLHESEKIVK